MVAYPNQVAFALFSFPGSVPHVGVCFGIKDLTFRGGLGALRISLKMNWMDVGVVGVVIYCSASWTKVTHGEQLKKRLVSTEFKNERRLGDAIRVLKEFT